ncbi:helix-turn-helix domain-containing protein [Litoreibacter roseus]|uniref:Helix-turn-helix domain-containing protein n=1 Tax=Litoreibacter roseus TaxID=2601869 RepID=A0A6N6JE84_9RHOB|nr:helix-turn-helix domain-containing protein [Litoreibacter roseus]GFE64435.1 hypothetical protein KIN_15090 [Litoreibacter roseus]
MANTADVIDLTKRFPTDDEIASAAEAASAIASACARNGGALRFLDANDDMVVLTPALCSLITDVLGHVSRGNMVTIGATETMLTTQQAADILNVSRPFLSKLLKEGRIPHVPVGSHRRVRFADLLSYKKQRDAKRDDALDDLFKLGQEFDAT